MACDNFLKAQRGAALLVRDPLARHLAPGQAAHLAAVARIAMQSMLALRVVLSSSAAAAAAAGAAAPATPAGPPFHVTWDFKLSVGARACLCFPVVKLKTAAAGPARAALPSSAA